jgi:regulator of protease activity HflC (stomatin/prohibitin superfamily)
MWQSLLLLYVVGGTVMAVIGYLTFGLEDIGEHERGVVLRLGKFNRLLGPGRSLVPPLVDKLIRVDLRPFTLEVQVPGLESRDGKSHEATLVAECRVLQPERAGITDYKDLTVQALEAVLRGAAAELDAKDLQASQQKLGHSIKKVANEATLGWGVDVQSTTITTVSTP